MKKKVKSIVVEEKFKIPQIDVKYEGLKRTKPGFEKTIAASPYFGSKVKDEYEFYKRNPSQLKTPGKIAGAVAGGTALAVGIKKGVDAYKNSHSLAGQTKKVMNKNGKKVAAGTLAALGAGVGVKALLKYLRKKKRS